MNKMEAKELILVAKDKYDKLKNETKPNTEDTSTQTEITFEKTEGINRDTDGKLPEHADNDKIVVHASNDKIPGTSILRVSRKRLRPVKWLDY